MAIIDSTSRSGTTLRRGQAVDQGVEDHRCGEDDAGLEAAAGAEVAVELHIQREQQDERDQQLGDHAQDEVVSWGPLRAARSPRGSCMPCGPAALACDPRRRSRAMTPAPAVKTTVVSPSVS
jgi:hypothetical protein